MSKRAEIAALRAYHEKDALNKKATGHYDANYPRRKAYQQGYEQAEKDNALTWGDIAKIITIYEEGIDNGDYRRYNEAEWMKEYSQDILRRFNEQKKEKRIREMREIKFRGKTKDGEWVYGYVDATAYKDLVVIHSEATTYEVHSETVGQYTGLEDKDGVEIFEGDIVEVHETPFNLSNIGVVIYYPETARFLIREQNKKYPRVFSFRKHNTYKDGHCTVECESDFHVLGNIHDNPELL